MLKRLLKNAGHLNMILSASILVGVLATMLQLGILGLGFTALTHGFTRTPWLGLGVLALVGGFARFGEQYLGHLVAFKLLSRFRNQVYQKIITLAPAKLDHKRSSDLLKLIAQDIEQIEIFYAHTLSPIVIAVLVSILQVWLFWRVAPSLGLIALLAYLTIGGLLPLWQQRRMQQPALAFGQADQRHQRLASETVHGKFELQQYQAITQQRAKLDQATTAYWQANRQKTIRQDQQAGLMQLILVGYLFIFGLVVVLQQLPLMWLLLFPFTFGRVLALATLPGSLSGGLLAAQHLFDLLDETPAVAAQLTGVPLTTVQQGHFDQVTFQYPTRPDQMILNALNFQFKAGQRIGIIGTSGEGKSTIVKLLMRWYAPTAGQLTLNQAGIETYQLTTIRKTMNYVPQMAQIFSGSLRENLTLRKANFTDQQLWTVLDWVHLTEFVQGLPHQLDTTIGADTENLSAGEMQRLELARALLHPSDVLILDEPTSNLDVLNEAMILAAVKQHYVGTVLIVTHRQSTLAICDQVYRLQNGQLAVASAATQKAI